MNGIIVDLFAGGGGASEGIRLALGRCPDVAINHDADAIRMHEANHPRTIHLREDIRTVSPTATVQGRSVALLWASPDCKHFSRAKGGKPREKAIRSLAWVTAVDHHSLVTVSIEGEPHYIADIGMRMLQPRELATAQGFRADYILTGTKTQQVARIGNSVCPPIAAAIVGALLPREQGVAA